MAVTQRKLNDLLHWIAQTEKLLLEIGSGRITPGQSRYRALNAGRGLKLVLEQAGSGSFSPTTTEPFSSANGR